MTILFSLTNVSFVNIQVFDLDKKQVLLFMGKDLVTGETMETLNLPITSSSHELSDPGSGEMSTYNITWHIPHAQRVKYGVRVEGNEDQRVRADHTGTLLFPTGGRHNQCLIAESPLNLAEYIP